MATLLKTDLPCENFHTNNEDGADENIDVISNCDDPVASPDKSINSAADSEGYHSRISDLDHTRNNNDTDKINANTSLENGSDYESGTEKTIDEEDHRKSISPGSKQTADETNEYFSTVEAKKARVENIITSMRHYPNEFSSESPTNPSTERGRKRKQYTPQQHDTSQYIKEPTPENGFLHAQIRDLQNRLQFIHRRMYNDNTTNDYLKRSYMMNNGDMSDRSSYFGHMPLPPSYSVSNNQSLSNGLSPLKVHTPRDMAGVETKNSDPHNAESDTFPANTNFKFSSNINDINELCEDLKSRLSKAITSVVDDFNSDFVKYQKHVNEEASKSKPESESNFEERPFHFPFYNRHDDRSGKTQDNPLRNLVDSLNRSHIHHPLASYPPLSAYYRYFPSMPNMMPPPPAFNPPTSIPLIPEPEPEQTEALSLVVSTPKKKRTKVTDTRLSPRAARALLHDGSSSDLITADMRSTINSYQSFASPISQCLSTSVAITNPSLQQSEYMRYMEDQSPFNGSSSRSGKQSPLQADQGSPGASHVSTSESARLSNMKGVKLETSSFELSPFYQHLPLQYTNTLTPMHLRKAKLMFFYVRYPSSSVLKTYFPDIQFNKNNTAQLVKWFSNFREFFYIQMEKYARQAIAEGVTNSTDLTVTTDSEIFRVLNLHYNRNNQLEVPERFCHVIETSLREFFMAVINGKDTEQPWKKSIYKVIQRLDEPIPDYFISPNWMELIGEA